MNKIAVIGAGVSGMTIAQELSSDTCNQVIVFEKEPIPGGLIRCQYVDGSLFHICGGHVFNSKREEVLNWFWKRFDKASEFTKADRFSVVHMPDGKIVPYPIENHVYCLDEAVRADFYADLESMEHSGQPIGKNFDEFLRNRFGNTLYQLYFAPYNKKVWKSDLREIPLDWMEGKLPMPTIQEMRYNNEHHVEEKDFVHATFYYEKQGGSQFIANRLAEGLNIRYNCTINNIVYNDSKVYVDGECFDKLIYCGNIKNFIPILTGIDLSGYYGPIEQLRAHGTTSVFCYIDANPYSWIYQPSEAHRSHRIICTGNFSNLNNRGERLTGTVEFTDNISEEEIRKDLCKMPLHPQYITHHYAPYTYPIQNKETRQLIQRLKETLAHYNIYLLGRFAEWEYYNMDAAMGAALDLSKALFHNG